MHPHMHIINVRYYSRTQNLIAMMALETASAEGFVLFSSLVVLEVDVKQESVIASHLGVFMITCGNISPIVIIIIYLASCNI